MSEYDLREPESARAGILTGKLRRANARERLSFRPQAMSRRRHVIARAPPDDPANNPLQ